MQKINLFCLPFAGGSRYSYRVYEKSVPSFINLVALEYPGRGRRVKESLITDADLMAEDLYGQIGSQVDETPYAIYGHSMGGLMAWMLAKRLIQNSHQPPLHLFITGATGPANPGRTRYRRHQLPKEEFIRELQRLKGSPDEILQDPNLLNFFEPIIRADFKVNETFQYAEGAPLDIPFTVITGMEELMKAEDILLWQKESRLSVDFRRLPGHHFFIYKHPESVTEIIARKLFSSLQ